MASLKDVAQKAGVSISTASRALGNRPGLAAETSAHVRKIAAELNYKPNPSARLLAGKSSKVIGIIAPELTSPYFSALIHEIEPLVQKKGYFLLIMNTEFDRQKELDALQTFCSFNVDGVFLPTLANMDVLETYIQTLSANKIAYVGLEAMLHNDNYNYIKIDDTFGMSTAISHFLEAGHKRVCFLSDYLCDTLRANLYKEALVRNNLTLDENPIFSHPSKRHEIGGYELMQTVLKTPNHPHAILAAYDDIAIGAIRAIEEAGFSIPDDYQLIGNDNTRSAPFLHKTLSTLSPPIQKMAELGVKVLLDQIEGRTPAGMVQHIILHPELIIRETG